MDDRIRSLIESLADETREAQLAELDDEALAGVEADLLAAFAEIRGDGTGLTNEQLDELETIAAAVGHVRDETARRVEVAAQAAAEAAERDERAAALAQALETVEASGDAEPDEGDDSDDDSDDDDAEPEPEEAAVEPEAEETPAVASPRRPSLAEMAARRPASGAPRRPTVVESRPRWEALDGSRVSLENQREIAERMVAAMDSIRGMETPAGFAQKIPVARIAFDYPDERRISERDSAEVATEKLRAVTASARDADYLGQPEVQALVAAGGWCGPAEPRYEFPSVVSAARPVRGGLPTIGATRGQLAFVRAPSLSSVLVDTSGGAITTHTAANDVSATSKTVQTFACGTVVERELTAIVARMQFGNLAGRAFPEEVANNVELVMAAHARVAEVALLDAIIAQINVDVAETGVVGTVRDVKNALSQAAAQLEYLERSETPIQAIVAREVLRMSMQDVTLQQASGELEALTVDRARARALLATADVSIIYSMEPSTGPDRIVANSDAGGQNLADYPDTFEIPIFPMGSVAFLDGGTLDLGIVRDSTLNATNDYQLFMETFEDAAWFGPRGLTLTLTTCPNGESQVATDETGSICSGS